MSHAPMNEDELNWRMLQALQILVIAARYYTDDDQLKATCTSADGQTWEIIVRPGETAPPGITAPEPVTFSQN